MNHIGTRELTTARLTLRRFALEDAPHMFYNWQSDPEVCRYLTWPPYESVEQVEAFLKKNWLPDYEKPDSYVWAIELNEIEQPIGSIGVVDLKEEIGAVELGYCIGRRFWNKGYMTEALSAVIRFFLEEVGAGRVSAEHDVNNPGSGRVMQKSGMTYEGTLRRAGRNNTGICDLAVYAKIGEERTEESEKRKEEPLSVSVTRTVAADGSVRHVISDETIEYVGILAKLELTEEEAQAAKRDMEAMLDYVEQLNELDTADVAPLSHVFPVHNVFREDVVTNGDNSAETLKNAPAVKNGGFLVPKTIGEQT